MARRRGSKDKQKRKSRLKTSLITAGVLGTIGIGVLGVKSLKDKLNFPVNIGKTPRTPNDIVVLNNERIQKDLKTQSETWRSHMKTQNLANDLGLPVEETLERKYTKEFVKRKRWHNDRKRRRLSKYLEAQRKPGIQEDLFIARNSKAGRKTAVKRVKAYFDDLKQRGEYKKSIFNIANFAKQIEYQGKKWTPNKPVKSDNPRKKYMVLATKKEEGKLKKKLIRFGDPNMQDYTQHKSKKRRKSYRARAKGIMLKSGKPAYKDKFQAAYWSMKKW